MIVILIAFERVRKWTYLLVSKFKAKTSLNLAHTHKFFNYLKKKIVTAVASSSCIYCSGQFDKKHNRDVV